VAFSDKSVKKDVFKKKNTNDKFSSVIFISTLALVIVLCFIVFIAFGFIAGAIAESSAKELGSKINADLRAETSRKTKDYVNKTALEQAKALSNVIDDETVFNHIIDAFNSGGDSYAFSFIVRSNGEGAWELYSGSKGADYRIPDFKKYSGQTISVFSNFSKGNASVSLCAGFAQIPGTDFTVIAAITEDNASALFKTETTPALINGSVDIIRNTDIVTAVIFSVVALLLAFAAIQFQIRRIHDSIASPIYSLCFDIKKTLEEMEGFDIEIKNDTEDEIEILADSFTKVAESLRSHIQDVMQLSGLTEKFENSANFDVLTGVFNRRRFFELVQPHAVIAAKKNAPTFVIMVDLDHFKRVNDTYGHAAGDEVLKTVAGKIKDAVRPSDLFGRYGGEEFVMFISVSDVTNAKGFADRIRGIIESTPVRFEDIDIPVTASMGLAQAAPDFSFEDALKFSDEALYRAKENGRNRVEIYTPETALTEEEKAIHGEKKKNK